jgi:hypothetical protein
MNRRTSRLAVLALWGAAVVCMTIAIVLKSDEWSHASFLLALGGVAATLYLCVLMLLGRLTQVIALWHEQAPLPPPRVLEPRADRASS